MVFGHLSIVWCKGSPFSHNYIVHYFLKLVSFCKLILFFFCTFCGEKVMCGVRNKYLSPVVPFFLIRLSGA